jgi:hypothetical protein
MSLATTPAPRVALYLDTFLSRELMAHVIERCRELGASLLVLAPQPRNLAASRLEPHWGALAQTDVEWEIEGIESDQANPFRDLDGIVLMVCEGGSALARYRGALPAPLLVLLNPETRAARNRPEPELAVDWLEPRFNRGV